MDRPDIREAASMMESHASSPTDADHEESGAMSDRTINHMDEELLARATGSYHIHPQRLGSRSRRQAFNERSQKAVPLSWWECELVCCGDDRRGSSWTSKRIRDVGNNPCVTSARDNQGVADHTARQGFGLAMHVHTRHLQAARGEGLLDVVKVQTERNPPDPLTKPLPFTRIQELCSPVEVECDQGFTKHETL